MTIAQEIQNLKDRIRMNQTSFARSMEQKDMPAMQYLAQSNRELINRLRQLEVSARWQQPCLGAAPESFSNVSH